jgi:thioredoxin reductase
VYEGKDIHRAHALVRSQRQQPPIARAAWFWQLARVEARASSARRTSQSHVSPLDQDLLVNVVIRFNKVIFNSKILEITPDVAVLDANGSPQRIPNDYVWVFAGGDPPTAFLKKIGISFGLQDLTSTGSKEAKEVIQEKVLVA